MSDVKTFRGAIEVARANPKFAHLSDDELAVKTVGIINAAIKANLLEVYYTDGLIGIRPTPEASAQETAIRSVMNTFAETVKAVRAAEAEALAAEFEGNDALGG